MAELASMSDRDVWVIAGKLLGEFGNNAGGHIVDQVMNFPGGPRTVEDWRRVARAIEAIEAARKH